MTTVTLEFPSAVPERWVKQFCQLYTTDPPILAPLDGGLGGSRWRAYCNVADAQRLMKFVQQTAISGPDDACRTECESPASQDPVDTTSALAAAVRTLADELKQDRATRLRDKQEGKAFLKAVLQGLCEGVSRHELQ